MGSGHLGFVSLSPVPLRHASHVSRTSFRRRVQVPRASLVDPSFVHFAHTPDLHSVSLLLSSAVAAGTDAAAAVSNAAADAAGAAVEAKKGGWFSAFEALISGALQLLHSQLQKAGIPGSYGLSIILFTVGIKTALFPVNYKQMESSLKMQALSPKIKQIQADYKDNPAVMNQMTAKLYKDEDVNLLVGCFPVLLQIPIWIALYRSLLDLAKDNLLNEPFLWLPSLQGPVSETGKGISTWLFPFVDGAPPIGWHDAICYMILPVLLVVSQVVSQKLMQPPSQDPEKQQANAFMKFLPLMIGWFALNVPSGLGVYWMTNNIFTTAQTWFIRSKILAPVSATISAEEVPSRLTTQTLEPADGFKSNGASRTSPAPKGSAKGSSRASRGGKKRRKRR